MSLLEVNHIQKTYSSPFSATTVKALEDASFSVEPGEFAAIMGESGSGKTTLLNILAMLDTPDAGTIRLKDKDIAHIPQKQRTRWRRDHLGFVFQDFNLLDTFTLKDNILLPMVLAKETVPAMMRKLTPLSELLGITDILTKFPYEVSGGQKQRAAIARALIRNPEILLADEPTGALDSASSELVLDLFDTINRSGQTILMVTHSAQAASHADRVLFIKDGRVHHQIWKGNKDRHQMYDAIQQAQSLMLAKGN